MGTIGRKHGLLRFRNLQKSAVGHCQIALVLCGAAFCTETATADDFNAIHRAARANYAQRLQQFSASVEKQEKRELAARVAQWLPRTESYQLYLVTRDHIDEATFGAEAKDARIAEFSALRRQQAEALFKLARLAATDGSAVMAVALAFEALRENPEHKAAAKVLGFERHNGLLQTASELRHLRAGRVWHDRFGWLPNDHVARYEDGQRNYNGRWITAQQEAKLRSNIARGWKVETEHFAVTTNHSLEAGVALAARLEQLYDVWWQLFAGYHLTDDELQRMFERGVQPRRSRRLHQVVYFRNRAEYAAALKKMQPGIERTLGIYFPDVRTSYFFAGDDQDPGTVLHEATHQLFQESRPAKLIVALRDNFWIVEGIACYMESLQFTKSCALVGGLDHGRVPAARVRLLKDGFYIPFAETVALGSRDVQRDPRIRTLYSQFTGQAAFLMHAEEGRFRDIVSRYLQEIYRGTAKPDTLARVANSEYGDLDRKYREFLRGEAPANDKSPSR
jgi:hypothetical protein